MGRLLQRLLSWWVTRSVASEEKRGVRYPEDYVHKVVEEMPLYHSPGCSGAQDYLSRKRCAVRAMLDYLYGNLRCPEGTEHGRIAVASFTVEPDGSTTDLKIVREAGPGTADEIRRLLRPLMAPGSWEPGRRGGKPVRVRFNLPLKFKLKEYV